MGQITKEFCLSIIETNAGGQLYPVTAWEQQQLAYAWMDREYMRKNRDAEHLVTVDKRDLFDFVRSAIRDALENDETALDAAALWAEATHRADEALGKLNIGTDYIHLLDCPHPSLTQPETDNH
jgi:hypothetical protein